MKNLMERIIEWDTKYGIKGCLIVGEPETQQVSDNCDFLEHRVPITDPEGIVLFGLSSFQIPEDLWINIMAQYISNHDLNTK